MEKFFSPVFGKENLITVKTGHGNVPQVALNLDENKDKIIDCYYCDKAYKIGMSDCKEIADTEEIIVNNGFFHRLIQAIRRLFFGVTTYQQ
mgnify:CR=1 FL=1